VERITLTPNDMKKIMLLLIAMFTLGCQKTKEENINTNFASVPDRVINTDSLYYKGSSTYMLLSSDFRIKELIIREGVDSKQESAEIMFYLKYGITFYDLDEMISYKKRLIEN